MYNGSWFLKLGKKIVISTELACIMEQPVDIYATYMVTKIHGFRYHA